jgi:ureidoglycolate hydrolase
MTSLPHQTTRLEAGQYGSQGWLPLWESALLIVMADAEIPTVPGSTGRCFTGAVCSAQAADFFDPTRSGCPGGGF